MSLSLSRKAKKQKAKRKHYKTKKISIILGIAFVVWSSLDKLQTPRSLHSQTLIVCCINATRIFLGFFNRLLQLTNHALLGFPLCSLFLFDFENWSEFVRNFFPIHSRTIYSFSLLWILSFGVIHAFFDELKEMWLELLHWWVGKLVPTK